MRNSKFTTGIKVVYPVGSLVAEFANALFFNSVEVSVLTEHEVKAVHCVPDREVPLLSDTFPCLVVESQCVVLSISFVVLIECRQVFAILSFFKWVLLLFEFLAQSLGLAESVDGLVGGNCCC